MDDGFVACIYDIVVYVFSQLDVNLLSTIVHKSIENYLKIIALNVFVLLPSFML